MTERTRHFDFRVINVKIRKRKNATANAADYVRIIRTAFEKKIHAESSPNKHCIIRSHFEKRQDNKVKYVYGFFAQFTYIENERWFNLRSLDLDKEFRVPDGLFPDAKMTEYVFIPAAHRFCYRIHSDFQVAPYPVRKFLDNALNAAANPGEFVQVDVESDRVSLAKILAAKFVKKITIDINYSNVDIGDDLKKFVEDDIKASNTDHFKIEATQKPNVSIDVKKSKILKGALESAVSNGEAEAKIIGDNNRVQTIKTTEYPRKESVYGKISNFNELVFEKIMSIFRPNAH